MSDKRSFTLDAMRGIAALSVAARHLNTVLPVGEVKNSVLAMPNSYLGVDFFFMLSGFVLARAYEDKLRAGLPAWRFMELRIVRLYPMFVLGIVLGGVMAVGQIIFHAKHALSPAAAAFAFAQNIFMVPDFLSGGLLYPLNMPAWTVLFEILINFVFVLLLFRMTFLSLMAFSLVCAACYFWGRISLNEGNLGITWATMVFGLARVGYGFPAGLILGRAFSTRIATTSPLAIGMVLLPAWIFFLGSPPGFRFAFDVACLFLILPVVIWLGAHFQPPHVLRPICKAMGGASYPLFAIHFPLLHIVYRALVRGLGLPGWPVAIGFIPFAFLLAWFLFQYADVPARRWLSARHNLRSGIFPVTS